MPHYGTVPNAVDAYTRYMVEVFDYRQIIGVPTGFQAFFGQNAASKTRFSPDAVDIDIDLVKASGEELAAILPRGKVGRSLGSTQKNTSLPEWKNYNRTFPLVEEEGGIDANQLLFRVPGESSYSNQRTLDRMRYLFLENHQEHVRRIVRLFEYMASQSILTGTMPAGAGETYDFQRNANLTQGVGTTWLDANATPIADIEGACQDLREIGYVTPDMIVMADDTINAFVTNSDVQNLADNRRFQLIDVNSNPVPSRFMKFVDGGFRPRGRIQTPAGWDLWLFSYVDGYTDSGGSFTKYMTDGYCLICYSEARNDRYFGPRERMPITAQEMAWYQELFGINMNRPQLPPQIMGSPAVVPVEAFYFDAYPPANKKSVTVRTQAAPIFANVQSDAFAVLTGCADAP